MATMWRRRQRRGDEREETRRDPWPRHPLPPQSHLSGDPAEMLAVTRAADRATVGRLITDLEERAGNEAVGHLVQGEPAHHPGTAEEEAEEVAEGPDVVPEEVAELETESGHEDEPPAPTRSGTDIVVGDAEPFPVTGTLRQVAGQLAARSEAGSVTSQVTNASYVATAAGRVRIVAITVNETLLMPVWTNRDERPPAEQHEWDRFYAALLAHEQEHVEIDRRVFANLHRACLRQTIERMNELIDEAVALADQQNRDFDTTTAHGRNTGTRISPPPEEEAPANTGPAPREEHPAEGGAPRG
jgi:hypothetical protein